MKYIKCQQGTPDWYAARAGKITASRFCDAISVLSRKSGQKNPGDPTDASDKYAAEVAIELVAQMPWGEPIKPWVLERGHRLEPLARQGYELKTGNMAEEAGVCMTEDGMFGYSTDGMVNPVVQIVREERPGKDVEFTIVSTEVVIGSEGLIEIKCPVDALKVANIWRTGDIAEYWEQMQGGMWITGAQWCDFVMYVPELARSGRDTYVQRVMRDDIFITSMERRLLEFADRVRQNAQLFGLTPALTTAPWPFPTH